jgi:hypothetical protein
MSPEQILAAMAEVYAECGSYRDRGQIVTRFVHDSDPFTTIKQFTTAFVRPGRFRFEYREEERRYIVWAGSGEVLTWWDLVRRLEQPESLGLALAGATGVSGGSARTVPALLLARELGEWRLSYLEEVISLGDERLDDITCYRLQGWDPPSPEDPAAAEEFLRVTGQPPERAVDGPLTLWIDRGTFLLRRIEEQVHYETYRTETVTTYEPAMGVTIGEDELRFDPPGGPLGRLA